MTTTLSERYVTATVNDLPAALQSEVRSELEASIADAIEARIEQGEDPEVSERTVLNEMGDPAVLAAHYADRPLFLIGPRHYLMWWHILKRLIVIVPIIAFSVAAVAQLLIGGFLGDMFGAGIPAAIHAIAHVGFWVTLTFAILDRTGVDSLATWDVGQLPEPLDKNPARPELIATLVFMGTVLVVLLWDQFPGIDGEGVPILNPELGPVLGLLALIVLEVVWAIVVFIRRGWGAPMAIARNVLTVLFFSWVVTLLTQGQFFGAEFLEQTDIGGDTWSTLTVIFVIAVALLCIWRIVDTWAATSRVRDSTRVQQQPTSAN